MLISGMQKFISAACLALAAAAFAQERSPVPNRAPLQQNAFNPLPLGTVHPRGWLHRQEEIQAGGLTGHLGDFWNDVGPNSGWLGGTGESWERGPYYLDGLLPLAYQLNDAKLIAKAKRWVDWSLNSQQPDGQFGPKKNDDWWPRMVMLKVLTQYAEVSGDPRVIPFMRKYFAYQLRELPNRPLRDWGKYRWQDNLYSVLWLYNRTGDKDLLKLAHLLHDQGYDWESQFANFKYTQKQTAAKLGVSEGHPLSDAAMQTHGVNNAMALKVAPLWWLVTGADADREMLSRQVAELYKYHGLPNGMFSADEHLAGPDPSQGIELCAVVESMFSLELDFSILGQAQLADRLERISYNALPATLSEDMWSHQYDQQPNQIACTRAHRQWSTNGPDSNLFGLAPNFGCCTANLHQGWPKFVSALWMATPDSGVVTTAYAPSEVDTVVAGKHIRITEETDYPFRGEVRFTVHSDGSFPLVLRVPGWMKSGSVFVNGKSQGLPYKNGFVRLRRAWKDGDVVRLKLDLQPRIENGYRSSAVFERGALVFSLPLHGKWTELKKYAEKSADWELTTDEKWNYAVQTGDCAAKPEEHSISEIPFSSEHPPVTLQVKGKLLPQWTTYENSAGPLPQSPVTSNQPLETLTLVPYGAAKLRVTAFPRLREQSRCNTATASGGASR